MEAPIKTADLAAVAGISLSYASEIVNDKRQPSRALAIHILRKTGWRHRVLSDLSDDQLDLLETIEPWAPSQAAA
jgi:transcriptional regulator with XRE-family HTH domain